MSALTATILILGLISGITVISFGLYYQFGWSTSTSIKLTKDDLTQEWTIQRCDSTFTPLITDINGQLIHVWFPNNGRTIHLESTASDCRISLPRHKRVKRPLQAVGSAIGNVIVAIIEEDVRNMQENFQIYYFHDRYVCAVGVIKDIDGATASNAAFLAAQHYTFDVFMKTDRYCGPGRICRRSYVGNTGKPVDLNDTDLSIQPDALWSINSIKKNVPDSGFIYTQMSLNNDISIERLDHRLKTLAKGNWSGIEVYSTNAGRISLCKRLDDQTLTCNLLNAELVDLVEGTINIHVDPIARDLQLHNLPSGGAIVLWIGMAERQVLYDRDTLVPRMRIIDAAGKVGEVIELLDHNVCQEYEIRSVEVIDGLCFRVGCASSVSVKCIVPDKDRLFNWV